MKFNIQNLIKTLIDIITGSPTSVMFIIMGIIFAIAMIINIKKNKTIGKSLYIMSWIFIISFIVVRYNNALINICDNLINKIFMQIFFPNLAIYALIIIISNIIFLFTINYKEAKTSDKIINSLFFAIIMILMIYLVEQISSKNINVYDAEEVYKNKNLLTLIECTTITFVIWRVIMLSKIALTKLIKKSDKKVEKKYELENAKINSDNDIIYDILETTESMQGPPEPTLESMLEPLGSTDPILKQEIENMRPKTTPIKKEEPIIVNEKKENDLSQNIFNTKPQINTDNIMLTDDEIDQIESLKKKIQY